MLTRFFRMVDGLSWVVVQLAHLSVVVLVVSMIYEVGARYIFNAPTVWAFDIAYMCSGALFLLGVAWTLKEDAHIRIDILRNKLPAKMAGAIEGGAYLFVLCPFFAVLTWIAFERTWRAWMKGEVEMVSPWAPLMWPFYLIIAVGLLTLTLQLASRGLQDMLGIRAPSTGDHA